jgi:hypothetical protein
VNFTIAGESKARNLAPIVDRAGVQQLQRRVRRYECGEIQHFAICPKERAEVSHRRSRRPHRSADRVAPIIDPKAGAEHVSGQSSQVFDPCLPGPQKCIAKNKSSSDFQFRYSEIMKGGSNTLYFRDPSRTDRDRLYHGSNL